MHAPPPDDAGAAEVTLPRSRPLPGPNPFRETRPAVDSLDGEPAPGPPTQQRGGRHAAVRHPGWHRFVGFITKPVFVFIVVGIIAAVPRFYHLTQPHGRVFDEVYYTKDGCLYAGFTAKQCGLDSASEQSWVHPPFGKWMIAAGIRLFGNNQFGWRVSAAFIGTLTVVLIAMLAWVLWRSSLWAFVAGLLAATESLLVVQSRTALLDIFQAFWTVAAFLFLALDKAWIERRTPVVVPEFEPGGPAPPYDRWNGGAGWPATSPWLTGPIPTTEFASPPEPVAPAATAAPARRAGAYVPSPFWRPWRLAAGFAFGFAIAVKWSALAAILGAMLLTILWERTRRARAGFRGPFWPVVGGLALGVLRFVAAVALGVGIATNAYVVAAVALVALVIVYGYLARRSGRFRFQPWIGLVWAGGVVAMRVGIEADAVALTALGVVAQVAAFVLVEVDRRRSTAPADGGARRPVRIGNPFLRAVMQESFPVIVCLFLLPVVVYLFTYSGRFEKVGYPPYKFVPGLSWSWMWTHPTRLIDETYQMEKFHHGLLAQQYDSSTKKFTPAHPYQSRPWSWLALGRPVAYYYNATDANTPKERRSEVLGIGNPAIFWLQFIAIPWLAVMWRRKRDWRAGLILLAILFQYGFWFLPDVSLQKVQFFFYATPIAPFFVLGATYLVRDLSKMRLYGSTSRPFLPVAVGFVVVSVALFLWFFPVLSGASLTVAQWKARIWFGGWI